MGNTLLTIDQITRKALQILKNKLVVTRTVNRGYDDSYAKEGAKIGATLRIRKPTRYVVVDGATLVVQDTQEQYTTLTASTQKHVGVAFSMAERTMSLDDYAQNVLDPAMSQLAATVDADVAQGVFKYIGQSVGTPGTTPATSLVLLNGMQKLDEAAAPRDRRIAVVNPAANAALVEGLKGLFNPSSVISDQFKSGLMGRNVLGYDEISMSQSIGNFTTGSRSAGATVTTTATQGATTLALTTNGATDTIKQGEVFTVAACYAINPQTRQSTGSLFQFVALADATASGSAVSVTVAPMYSADAASLGNQALATMDALPVSTAAVTWMGGVSTAYPQNLIYHPDAISFATADLILPDGVSMASRMNYDGISLSAVKAFDIINYREICRIDILYGYGVIRPELACRLWG